ncbi:MAG: hypothetical protein WBX37_23925 [Pseudolabrys sp.]
MKKQNWQRGDKAPGDDTGVKNSREPTPESISDKGKYKEIWRKLEDREYQVSGHRKGFS